MVIFMNDPKRTVISVSVHGGEYYANLFYGLLTANGLKCKEIEEKPECVIFRDITGKTHQMSTLLKSMEDLEWDWPQKVYILISGRNKGGKKHVPKNRAETGEGREGGDREGADPDSGHGEADRVGGAADSHRDPGGEPAQGTQEAPGTHNDCDQ